MYKTVTYIVEGQTEEAFLNNLKSHAVIDTGKVKVFNLMQKQMKETNPILYIHRDEFICIIDTDCCDVSNIENLIVNI